MALENLDRWTNDGSKGPNHYDWAIAGIPFLSAASNEYPYLRESLDVNKQQINTSKDVGENSLGNWWYSSQSSFDRGANAFYTDTAKDENVGRRFYDSHGIDALEEIGQVTLQNKMQSIKSTTSSNIKIVSYFVNGVDGIIYATGKVLNYYTSLGVEGTLDYSEEEDILDIDSDGTRYFVLTPTSVYAGPIDPTETGYKVIEINREKNGDIVNASAGILKFTKERLVIGVTRNASSYLYQCAVGQIGETLSFTPTSIQGVDATDVSPKGIKFTFANDTWAVGTEILKVEGSQFSQYNFTGSKVITYVSGTNSNAFQVAASTLPAKVKINEVDVYPQDVSQSAKVYTKLANQPIEIYKSRASYWNWSAIADGPQGIYCSGYSGEKSAIMFSTIAKQEANDIPELQPPYVVAELPAGEIILSMVSYLSVYLVIGTNLGVRVAIIDSRGGLIMGPLSIKSDNDVRALAVSGDFVYAGGGKSVTKDGVSKNCIYKLNLSKPVQENTLSFSYQKFLFDNDSVYNINNHVVGIVKFNSIDRICFAVKNIGIFKETAVKVTSGWLETGKIRLDTAEDKIFQYLRVSNLPTDGFISVYWRDETNTLSTTPITAWYCDDYTGTIPGKSGYLTDPTGIKAVDMEGTIPVDGEISAHPYISYRFVLEPGLTTTNSPTLLSYQVKANPANIKQNLIRLPLLAMNREKANGLIIERPVFDRVRVLEKAEQQAKVVLFQDFGTGEERLVVIDKIQFISNLIPENRTAADRGGILLVTIRTVDPVNTTGSLI